MARLPFPGRRLRAAAVVLAVAIALPAVTVTDARFGPAESPSGSVDPSTSASAVYETALANTAAADRRVTSSVHRTVARDSDLAAVWFARVQVAAEQYHAKLFVAPDSSGEGWTVDEVYLGEHVAGERLGAYAGDDPAFGVRPRNASGTSGAVYAAFEASTAGPRPFGLDGERHPEHLRVVSVTDDEIVLGVVGARGYAAYRGYPDSRSALDGSYFKVYVDRETGRITRIEDRGGFVDEDGERRGRYVEVEFAYGRTAVKRPGWVAWDPRELLYDALTYSP